MKQPILTRTRSKDHYPLKINSIKVRILFASIVIVILLCMFLSFISFHFITTTGRNALSSFGENIFSNYVKNFDMKTYLSFLNNPTPYNPSFDKCRDELKELRLMLNANFVYTIKLDEKNKEVMLVDSSEQDLFLPTGYILRDRSNPIVKKTYAKKKFIKAQHINNSWGNYYSFYFPLKDSDGNIVSLLGVDLDSKTLHDTIFSYQKFISKSMLKFFVLIFFISMILTIISLLKITSPINSIRNILNTVSDGNLTANFKHDKKSDEFSLINNLFIDMVSTIKSILTSIITTSKNIANTFDNIETKKSSIVSKIVDIDSLTFNISKSNEKIFLNTNNIKDEIIAFNAAINKMHSDLSNIKDISKGTQEICKENTENIKGFIEEMDPLVEKFEEFKESTLLLNKLSSEIKQVLKEIHEISNQTKLLSLNASIVAASAGEHGDGFTVVSREIGEFSYKTSQSISLIQDTLATIIKTIKLINIETINTSYIFKEQSIKSSMFLNNLTSINKLSSEIYSTLEDISNRSKQLTDKNEEILSTIKYINDESKSNNSILKSVSNYTGNLIELTEYFRIEFRKINRYIKNIRNSYKVFKIKKEE